MLQDLVFTTQINYQLYSIRTSEETESKILTVESTCSILVSTIQKHAQIALKSYSKPDSAQKLTLFQLSTVNILKLRKTVLTTYRVSDNTFTIIFRVVRPTSILESERRSPMLPTRLNWLSSKVTPSRSEEEERVKEQKLMLKRKLKKENWFLELKSNFKLRWS